MRFNKAKAIAQIEKETGIQIGDAKMTRNRWNDHLRFIDDGRYYITISLDWDGKGPYHYTVQDKEKDWEVIAKK